MKPTSTKSITNKIDNLNYFQGQRKKNSQIKNRKPKLEQKSKTKNKNKMISTTCHTMSHLKITHTTNLHCETITVRNI